MEGSDACLHKIHTGPPALRAFCFGLGEAKSEQNVLFGKNYEFFSTFGGNPVACATAGAVLGVIEREGLQANVQQAGGDLIDGVRQAAAKT